MGSDSNLKRRSDEIKAREGRYTGFDSSLNRISDEAKARKARAKAKVENPSHS